MATVVVAVTNGHFPIKERPKIVLCFVRSLTKKEAIEKRPESSVKRGVTSSYVGGLRRFVSLDGVDDVRFSL